MEALIPKSAEDTFPLGIDLQDDQDSEQYDVDDIDDSVILEDDIPATTFPSGDTLQ